MKGMTVMAIFLLMIEAAYWRKGMENLSCLKCLQAQKMMMIANKMQTMARRVERGKRLVQMRRMAKAKRQRMQKTSVMAMVVAGKQQRNRARKRAKANAIAVPMKVNLMVTQQFHSDTAPALESTEFRALESLGRQNSPMLLSKAVLGQQATLHPWQQLGATNCCGHSCKHTLMSWSKQRQGQAVSAQIVPLESAGRCVRRRALASNRIRLAMSSARTKAAKRKMLQMSVHLLFASKCRTIHFLLVVRRSGQCATGVNMGQKMHQQSFITYRLLIEMQMYRYVDMYVDVCRCMSMYVCDMSMYVDVYRNE